MGIDITNDFQPEYEISEKSKRRACELKRLAKKVDEVILASDEDREGEAIAWHLTQILETEVKDTECPIGHSVSVADWLTPQKSYFRQPAFFASRICRHCNKYGAIRLRYLLDDAPWR